MVDGAIVSDGVWNAIRASGRQVAQSLLALKVKKEDESRTRKKAYFKTCHSEEWLDAIAQLEQLQLLLQYCASHWKADYVLGSILSLLAGSNG